MSTEKLRPSEIRHDRTNGRVIVRWDDGTDLQTGLDDLRNKCPCAGCRGHSPGEVEPPNVRGIGLKSIAEVGNYAIRFSWSDGHDSGIYTWKYLREVGEPIIV